MRIKKDLLKISSGALNVKGERLEPEEQVVRREVTVAIDAKHGQGKIGKHVGTIQGSIVTDTTALETATAMRHLCGNCKFFRNDLWMRDLKKNDSPESPIEKRRAVNQIRAALLQTQNMKMTEFSSSQDGDFEVEHAMRSLGYCQALFEFQKAQGKNNEEATTLVHPASSCPQDVKSEANPHGFFTPASKEAQRQSDANFDSIMQRAQGKI